MSNATASYVMVIDTETTGLPPRYAHPSMAEAWDVCRLVQVAWEVYDADANHVSSECYIVRPDGFSVPESSSRIHGITHENAERNGVPVEDVWERLSRILPCVKRIVAHNMEFDDKVIQSEMHRTAATFVLQEWQNKQKVCTMKRAKRPNVKWPRLIELYEEYFGRTPQGSMHRADNDVRACAEIYFHQQKNLALTK